MHRKITQFAGQASVTDRTRMRFSGLKDLIRNGGDILASGPIALILIEDEIEVDTTLRHHLAAGFKSVLAFMPPSLAMAPTSKRWHIASISM